MEFPLLPSGDPLPLPYRWIRAHGLRSIIPWHFDFDDPESVSIWRETYNKNTGRDAWPFAGHQCVCEVAAFPLLDGRTDGRVIIIDTDPFDTWGDAPPGGTTETFPSFLQWFSSAIQESFEAMNEEDVVEMLRDLD